MSVDIANEVSLGRIAGPFASPPLPLLPLLSHQDGGEEGEHDEVPRHSSPLIPARALGQQLYRGLAVPAGTLRPGSGHRPAAGQGLLHGQGGCQSSLSHHRHPARGLASAGHALAGAVLLPPHASVRPPFLVPPVGAVRDGSGVDHHPHIRGEGPPPLRRRLVPGSSTATECRHNLGRIKLAYEELGVPDAADKTEGPSTRITFLGIQIDSQAMTVSLDQPRLDAIRLLLREWVDVSRAPFASCSRPSGPSRGQPRWFGTAAPSSSTCATWQRRTRTFGHHTTPRASPSTRTSATTSGGGYPLYGAMERHQPAVGGGVGQRLLRAATAHRRMRGGLRGRLRHAVVPRHMDGRAAPARSGRLHAARLHASGKNCSPSSRRQRLGVRDGQGDASCSSPTACPWSRR